jgi:hypothetical protein
VFVGRAGLWVRSPATAHQLEPWNDRRSFQPNQKNGFVLVAQNKASLSKGIKSFLLIFFKKEGLSSFDFCFAAALLPKTHRRATPFH